MVINSSQVLISELEFRSHSGDLAPLLYYYKQKPCTLQGSKIDNSLTNICRWCTEMCVFWPKAAALPCFPAEHSANAAIHSPYELLVPLIPLKNCFHTSIAARLILPENFISQSGIVRIENGTKIPSISALVEIANALSVSTDELLLDCLEHSSSTANSEIHRLLLDCNETEQTVIIRMAKELKAILVSLGV